MSKKPYTKPVVAKRETLQAITAVVQTPAPVS